MSVIKTLQNHEHMTELEKNIANYILAQDISNVSSRMLASKLYTSPSKIIRFFQKIGFKGYTDFKEQYINEIMNKNYEIDYNYPFTPNDKTTQLANRLSQLYHQHLHETLQAIDHDSLNKALKLMLSAKEIVIISSGTQASLAKSFQEKMLKIGANVTIESQLDLAYYRICYAKNTLYIIISYSGQTPQTLKLANKIKERHLPIIALTTKGIHPLYQLANVCLYLSTHESLIQNVGNFGTNISTLFLLDLLYAQYFNQDYHNNISKRFDSSSSFQTMRKATHPSIKD